MISSPLPFLPGKSLPTSKLWKRLPQTQIAVSNSQGIFFFLERKHVLSLQSAQLWFCHIPTLADFPRLCSTLHVCVFVCTELKSFSRAQPLAEKKLIQPLLLHRKSLQPPEAEKASHQNKAAFQELRFERDLTGQSPEASSVGPASEDNLQNMVYVGGRGWINAKEADLTGGSG